MDNSLIAALSVFMVAGAGHAQELNIDFDPAKTQINWTLVGNVHTVHGTFRLKVGHLTVDRESGSITGDLVADATSGESGNGARDRRMNKEILECERYPEIRMTPQKVEGTINPNGPSTVRVSGAFLIHGGTHQVTLPLQISFAGGTVTGSGKFSVPYVEWGMKDPSNFLFKVDKSVEVEIVANGKVTAK